MSQQPAITKPIPPTESKQVQTPSMPVERSLKPVTLRKILDKHYSFIELKVLCGDLGFDYQNMPHSTRQELGLELVAECRRKGKLEQLANLIPDNYWTQM